jgi:hypothetical protein
MARDHDRCCLLVMVSCMTAACGAAQPEAPIVADASPAPA